MAGNGRSVCTYSQCLQHIYCRLQGRSGLLASKGRIELMIWVGRLDSIRVGLSKHIWSFCAVIFLDRNSNMRVMRWLLVRVTVRLIPLYAFEQGVVGKSGTAGGHVACTRRTSMLSLSLIG